MKKPLLVFKFGTSSLTNADGSIDHGTLQSICLQLRHLADSFALLVVSSGAVGAGKAFLQDYTGSLVEKKAAASIGNPILMQEYALNLRPLPVAQILCEKSHFHIREKFLQLRETIFEVQKSGGIPIANENDVVSSHELCFTDNDELATMLACSLGAEHLLIGTNEDGVLDENRVALPEITNMQDAFGLVKSEMSTGGTGGMRSKLTCAKKAQSLGIKVTIFKTKTPQSLEKALKKEIGTHILPKTVEKKAYQRWIAAGAMALGQIWIDKGAYEAILKRKSLLAVGILHTKGDFDAGESVELCLAKENGETVVFGVGKTKKSAKALENEGKTKDLVVVHADEMVIMA